MSPNVGLFLYTQYILQFPKWLLQIACYTLIVHLLYKLIKMKRHNPQNSSLHLFLGLPLGLFPATCPFITLFTRLPSFSIIFSLHNSLLLFTCATTASCFNLSLIALFHIHVALLKWWAEVGWDESTVGWPSAYLTPLSAWRHMYVCM